MEIHKNLKNPRVRRMLDLTALKNKCPASSSATQTTDTYVLRGLTTKNYNEREEDNEDFSPDESEYCPSPKHHSQIPSSSSSLGGDTECIDNILIKYSEITNTPSTVSNLSAMLDNVDFVASPHHAIYKIKATSTPSSSQMVHEILDKKYGHLQSSSDNPIELLHKYDNLYAISSENIPHNLNDDTLKPDGEENTVLQINNLVMDISVDKEDLHVQTNSVDTEHSVMVEPINSTSSQTLVETNQLGKLLETPNSSVKVQREEGIQKIVQDAESNSRESILSFSLLADNGDNVEECELTTSEHEKKRTRKRLSDKNNWIDNKNKILKNSGKEYEGCRSKKKYPGRAIGPSCTCNKKCGEKFTLEKRQDIFEKFYKLADHQLQWQYIVRHTESKAVKRMTLERKNNRTQTISYYFNLEDNRIQVCKVFFLKTLNISEQTVYTALEKIKKDESLINKRGLHGNRPHKMSAFTKESIMKHIKLFPAVEAHYIRKDSTRQYLSEHLIFSKLFRLYEVWFSNQNYSIDLIGSKRQYEHVFNTEFNYSFFKPKKDLCATCSLYEQSDVATKVSLEDKYNKHITRKNMVRQIKNEEKATADRSNTTIAVFDLEKVLYVPQSEVGIFYYKRKYPIYNFTVFNTLNKQGYCFVWHLSIAKRGSIEVGSCLLKFIESEHQRGIQNISFYSDGCAGQNKNRFIFALYLYAVKKFGIQITHKFFETGHSQNEGDSMHSCIERAMKKKVLFTPDQVYSVVINSKLSGEKYKVIEMDQLDFYDIKTLVQDRNWIKDEDGRKVAWSKIMEVKATNSKPNILEFRYEFQDEYSELNTASKATRTRRLRTTASTSSAAASPADISNDCITLKHAYNQPIPVRKALYDDLQNLCTSGAIPAYYHPFYNSIRYFNGEDEAEVLEQSDCEQYDVE